MEGMVYGAVNPTVIVMLSCLLKDSDQQQYNAQGFNKERINA